MGDNTREKEGPKADTNLDRLQMRPMWKGLPLPYQTDSKATSDVVTERLASAQHHSLPRLTDAYYYYYYYYLFRLW